MSQLKELLDSFHLFDSLPLHHVRAWMHTLALRISDRATPLHKLLLLGLIRILVHWLTVAHFHLLLGLVILHGLTIPLIVSAVCIVRLQWHLIRLRQLVLVRLSRMLRELLNRLLRLIINRHFCSSD